MSLSDNEMDFNDDLVFGVRGQQALGGHDDDDDGELGQFVLTQKPDPDGHTFKKFQQAATFSNDRPSRCSRHESCRSRCQTSCR